MTERKRGRERERERERERHIVTHTVSLLDIGIDTLHLSP